MEEFQRLARKLFLLFFAMFAVIIILFVSVYTYEPSAPPSTDKVADERPSEWQPKDVLTELASMPPQVKRGYLLIAETNSHMGPMVDDPNGRFAGNGLACANCHLKAEAQVGSASWVGVTERFPQFGGRSNKIGTIGRFFVDREKKENAELL
jgi:thiosulfate dehydrogenase